MGFFYSLVSSSSFLSYFVTTYSRLLALRPRIDWKHSRRNLRSSNTLQHHVRRLYIWEGRNSKACRYAFTYIRSSNGTAEPAILISVASGRCSPSS